MTKKHNSEPADFLPYLLNMAAEKASQEFQCYYKDRYGMLRTEWRVLFHLGCYGDMRAKDICERASIHKTKVSRAVSALERKRLLRRTQLEHDRRQERLQLTPSGSLAFQDLHKTAQEFDAALTQKFTAQEVSLLRRCLHDIIDEATK